MIHRPERLSDLFYLLKKYNLEPKKLRLIHSYQDSKPKLILVKATKNAKSFLCHNVTNEKYIPLGTYA